MNKDDKCVLVVVAFNDKKYCVLNLKTQETILKTNDFGEALDFAEAEAKRLGGVKHTCVSETIYNWVFKPKGKPLNWIYKFNDKASMKQSANNLSKK